MLAQEGTEMVLDRPAWDQASSLLDPPVIYAGLGEKIRHSRGLSVPTRTRGTYWRSILRLTPV
jgi:hypothetical protein